MSRCTYSSPRDGPHSTTRPSQQSSIACEEVERVCNVPHVRYMRGMEPTGACLGTGSYGAVCTHDLCILDVSLIFQTVRMSCAMAERELRASTTCDLDLNHCTSQQRYRSAQDWTQYSLANDNLLGCQ